MKCAIVLILFLTAVAAFAQNSYTGTVSDFVGLNTNVGAYDDKIVEKLGHAAKWMREYHSWNHFEKTDDVYAWDDTTPSGYGTWPFHTKFVEQCVANDINLLIVTQGSTEWAAATGKTDDPPFGDADGSSEEDYIDKVEFVSQLVARYASKKIDDSLLETADKKSGLGYVMYYEDANEPDFWWHEPLWPGDLYGVYLNAVHDGRNLTPGGDYPLLGIKNVDPDAVHVMGGLGEYDEDYLNDILSVSGDRLPFDVINFHYYCTEGWGSSHGVCPEHKTRGLKPEVEKWQQWRDEHAPSMPIWLTEFGWDTYKDGANSSYIYAGEQSQANYLLRSIFLLMGYGIDKAFVFFDKDPNSTSAIQFSSSGILTDKNHGLEGKISYYYLATLQNVLGDYSFVGVDKYAEGSPEIYSYVLQSPTDVLQYCYVLWRRNGASKYDDGGTIENYVFAQPGLTSAVLIKPIDLEEFGEEVAVSVLNPGAENSSVTIPTLSETPVFLFVELAQPLAVAGNQTVVYDFHFSAYPNPFNPSTHIAYDLPEAGPVRFEIYNVLGQKAVLLLEPRQESGRHVIVWDGRTASGAKAAAGLYFCRMTAGELVRTIKMTLLP